MTFQSPVPFGATFAGKYRVDRVLGEGGMGIVVAAHHLELDQPVAVKFLLDDVARNVEGSERFRREARAAAKIQSEHVVRVLDVGVLDSGERYMVMEYLDGHDLAEELRQQGQLPTETAVRYLLEALDAITQAHATGIVHRDLKPANLYLARRPDGIRRIKVLDFGISKSMNGTTGGEQLSLTRTSAWIGSPLYMAPEQMQSARDVDARADIWSLGAILYELLTGRPPYPAESLPQLCNLLLTTDVQPLRELRPDVPPSLNDVVMHCLTRPVDQRLSSAPELTAALIKACPLALGSGRSSLPSAPFSAPISVELGSFVGSSASGGLHTGTLQSTPATAVAPEPKHAQTMASQTAASWGRTGEGASPGRFKLWLGLGTAALVAAAAFAFWPSSSANQTDLEAASAETGRPETNAPSAPAASEPVAPARVDSSPQASPSAEIAPSADSADSSATTTAGESVVDSAAPPASAPAPGLSSSSIRPVRPVKATTVRPSAPAAPTSVPAKPASSAEDIINFGGRR